MMRFVRDPLVNPDPLIRRVYSYVAYRLGDGPDAEDVTSDVFERALRYKDSYDRERGEPIAWLMGIARRCISETLAQRHNPAPPPREEQSEEIDEHAIRRLALRGAVRSLEERDQELIALRYGADLTARQIADVLGQRTNSVEVALHRALARLRTELEREEEPRKGFGAGAV
jgi:RNA polymerase sigma factor (sigma-70 family)